MKKKITILSLLFSLNWVIAVSAQPSNTHFQVTFQVSSLFHDNAILQRETPVPVWGAAGEGETVTVEFAGQKVNTVAKKGTWKVWLKPMMAKGDPQTLTIQQGETTLTFTNMLVGDVWVASGQSNMQAMLRKGVDGWEQAVATANFPLIHQYYVPEHVTNLPAMDAGGTWTVCAPATAQHYSAIGFIFAREIFEAEKVPLGILFPAWGGTLVESWTSQKALDSIPAVHAKELIPDRKPGGLPTAPSVIYNAMIAPLQQFPIKGVIWYQGEANNLVARQYRELFPLLISDWRQGWGESKMPFLFVQIAPYRDMKPELREAQFLTLEKSPHTAMAVTIDVGDANNIHPARKAPVGHRLALAARALAYGEKIEYSGPLFASMKIKGGQIILSFNHADSGLVAKGGELKGFTIADADKQFVPAKTKIAGSKIIVWSEEIAKPVAVRYGWDFVPDGNLFNGANLPASPFRTDVD
ncbi:MAG TPA: sialate O-acetylesterase [Verrucomicrobiae bacterium]|nr:sialate O-acetylesterase [Verrucomicrobiae bacterium]